MPERKNRGFGTWWRDLSLPMWVETAIILTGAATGIILGWIIFDIFFPNGTLIEWINR